MKVRNMLLVLFLLVVTASSSFAQCVPMNGPFIGPSGHMIDPPRTWDGSRGCYIWQGAPSSGQVTGQQAVGQNVIPAQQVVNVNGQPMVWARLSNGQMALVPYHRPHHQVVPVYQAQPQVVQQYPAQQQVVGGGFSKCEVIGGIAGGVIGSTASIHNNRRYHPQAVALGTIIGGVIGNTACQPDQVQSVQQYPVQNVVAQQQVQQGQGTPSCDAGKRPGILNLQGNPKHGQHVCAFPGDPNISQWL